MPNRSTLSGVSMGATGDAVTAMPAMSDHQDGTGRHACHLVRYRTQKVALHRAHAAPADHDQIAVMLLGEAYDAPRDGAVAHEGAHVRGAQLTRLRLGRLGHLRGVV